MKRFDLITEADARLIEPGSTVELVRGGRVTPLARDTLRERRVTVVEAGFTAETGEDLIPVADVRRVAVGSDHRGVALRRAIVRHLRGCGLAVTEIGPADDEPADYPDVAAAIALAVARRESDAGIAIDGSGLGSAIAANKVKGVRAAVCADEIMARHAREHVGANVLALAADVPARRACAIVDVWRTTAMCEPRYVRRLVKIRRIEEG